MENETMNDNRKQAALHIARDTVWFAFWSLLGGPALILLATFLYIAGTDSLSVLLAASQAPRGNSLSEMVGAIQPLYGALFLASLVLYTLVHFWRVSRRPDTGIDKRT